ncbi:MAG: hypothetical protein IPK93_06450 [Solirubrobacterales bacterium]|nr:hypothetical protein [Solirubrobacterales bacterium]
MARQVSESLGEERTWQIVERLREAGLKVELAESERRQEGGPLEGKTVVLTGTLEGMTRTKPGRW